MKKKVKVIRQIENWVGGGGGSRHVSGIWSRKFYDPNDLGGGPEPKLLVL